VIAEDEKLLRDELVALLGKAWPDLELLEACEDGATALEAIANRKPDVAFLDIRMPGLTGLEVAAAAAEASPATQVVFVTAYNQYAIDAFERGAVDYLLKPIAPDRLAATVKRVKARLASGDVDPAAIAALVAQLRGKVAAPAARPPLQWITASAGKETRLILVDDVAYFRADDKYTVVMTAEGESLIRKPIKELVDELDPNMFWQIHRSTLVNVNAIAGVSRDLRGHLQVKLKQRNEHLPVSEAYNHLFRQM
jgi:DNA-binding LytR/AlgR family response regulator